MIYSLILIVLVICKERIVQYENTSEGTPNGGCKAENSKFNGTEVAFVSRKQNAMAILLCACKSRAA